MSIKQQLAVVDATGDATGRLSGIKHLQLMVRDMRERLLFYRGEFGLRRLIRRYGRFSPADFPGALQVEQNDSFQLANGEVLTLMKVPACVPPEESVFLPNPWPGVGGPPKLPAELDHLARHVPAHEDLVWVRRHLGATGCRSRMSFSPVGTSSPVRLISMRPTAIRRGFESTEKPLLAIFV